jgi:hypothetical protein
MGFLMPLLAAAPAQAQATRTWVSGVGDDVNPCSRTAPCKTFAGAISKTATGGEINCLDPGGFGAVTITKSISIICDAGTAGVLVQGTNGIIVNAANSNVILEGLDIDGVGSGINGVTIINSAKVHINKTIIKNFTQNGVNVAGPVGARAVIQDTVILNNGLSGVAVAGASAAVNSANLVRTTIDNHPTASVSVTSPSSVNLSGNTFLGSAASVTGTGTVNSFGNNAFGGTVTITTTNPLK